VGAGGESAKSCRGCEPKKEWEKQV